MMIDSVWRNGDGSDKLGACEVRAADDVALAGRRNRVDGDGRKRRAESRKRRDSSCPPERPRLGIPAACSLAAAFLVVFAAGLALFATTAQAQTTVWSATLTPRATFSGTPVPLGCDNTSTGNRKCSNSNTLSDDFTDDGTTYAVTKFFTRNGVLTFRLDTGATAATQGLTLVIDGEEFVLKEADQINGGKTQWKWNSTTLGWTAGTDVAVSLVATDAPATGQPTISGGGQVGKTLTAATDDIEDPDGLPTNPTFTYQWVRVDGSTDTDIPGATSETYTLTASDLGKQIKVKVSFTDFRGHAEGPLTSDAYPRNGTVTVVVLPGPCPAVNDWCATMTVAENGPGFGYEFDKAGSLDDNMIEYGGKEIEVFKVYSLSHFSGDEFFFESIPRVPRGTVITVGDLTFTTDAESDNGIFGNEWVWTPGELPPELLWSDGQEVRISLVLGSFPAEGAPAITGAAQVGKTLTAGLGTIADTDGLPATFPNDYMFQWVRVDADGVSNETPIGANAATYTLAAADAGKKIKVKVSFTDDRAHPEAVTSEAYPSSGTIMLPAGVTVSKSALTVTEQDATGDTYTVVLNSRPTASVTVTVGGYTGSDVTPNPASLTFAPSVWNTVLTVTVTAEGDMNTVDETVSLTHSATSTDTDYSGITIASVTVTVDDNANPAAEGKPTISGPAQVGRTLTAATADITDADGLTMVSYEYQWIASGTVIADATSSTYTPTSSEQGDKITVRVTFDDDEDNPETLTSDETAPVVPDAASCGGSAVWCSTLTVGYSTPDLYGAFVGLATNIRTPPESFGSLVGATFTHLGTSYTVTQIFAVELQLFLATSPNLPDDGAGLTLHIQRVSGTYALKLSDRAFYGIFPQFPAGTKVWYFSGVLAPGPANPPLLRAYSGVNGDYEQETDEGTLLTVSLFHENRDAEGTPTISGTAQVGQVLTADPSGITDADGLTTATFTYQWLRVDADGVSNETPIGTNAATYTLAAADAGKKIKVKVSFTDDGGTAEGPLTSDAYPSQGTTNTSTLSTDATLSDLELWDNTGTAITLTPSPFVSTTTSYTAMVANSVDEITIFPKENDDNAPYEIQDSGGTALTDADSVEDDFQVTLSVGDNTIKVEVTAEDGSTQTYTVTVTRAAGTPTAGVTVSKSALTVTEQDATGDTYTVVLDSRPTASVTVTVGGYTGSDVTPNPASLTWAPSVWNIPLTVTVTAEGDTNTVDETVSLTHSATSTDTDYSGITIASVTVTVDDNDNPNTPPEGTPTISGTAQVGEVLTADPSGITDADGLTTATFTYQWLRVDADGVSNETNIGTNAATYTLAAADAGKKIKVKVSFTDDGGTAEGPLTSDAYPSSGTITSALSTDATLSDLELWDNTGTAITLTPTFVSATTSYTAMVANSVDEITIFPKENDDNAPYEIQDSGGTALTDADSVEDEFQVTLSVGDNTIKVEVTAEDGSTQTYTVTVTRAAGTPTAGVTVSKSALTVTEQDATGDTYTVVLDRLPTANVTVTVGGFSSSDVTANPATLTFTTLNWDTAQTVTVKADNDADTANDTVTLTHSAASTDADYSAITIADVAVTVEDNDTAQVTGVTIAEGNAQLVVRWTAVDNATGYTVQWKSDLQENYNTGDRQARVTPGSTTSHTISGLANDTEYTVQVGANRTGAPDGQWSVEMTGKPVMPTGAGVTVSKTALTVTEEDATGGSYTVVLDTQPTADVTVTVAVPADTTVTLTPDPPTLTFTTMNWETAQTVTVKAGDDADTRNDAVTLTHSAASTDADYSGITIADVAVTVDDNDIMVTVTPGDAQLVVEWTAVDRATRYTVQWKSDSGATRVTVTSGSTTRYTIRGLTNDTEYTVQVIATRTGASDVPSAEVTGKPAPPTKAGVTVSKPALTVTEENTTGGSYTVVLDTEPTADVTVTVAVPADTTVTLTPDPPTLTFTTMNWETAQTVTVKAGDDADTRNDAVTLTHSAASTDADYSGITIAAVAVTVDDNDIMVTVTPGDAQLVVEWTAVDTATRYTVRWKSDSGDTRVTVTPGSTTRYTIRGLTNDTEYTVRVIANRTGASDVPSSEVTGTPTPPLSTQQQAALAPLAAGFVSVPPEHDGTTEFWLELTFDAPVAKGSRRHIRALLGATGGTVTRLRRKAGRLDHWKVGVEPSSHGAITVSLAASPACGETGAVCTPDGRTFTTALATRIQGPPGLTVADAAVQEAANATLAFAVTLSRAASGTVTVDYATTDASAQAGVDYTATRGTLTFQTGESSKTITVAVLDDVHDEGEETLTLTLANAAGAYLADGTATGRIRNTDSLPQALMARFGRTAAVHVVERVEERMAAPREVGVEAQVAGRQVRPGMEREMALDVLRQLGASAGRHAPGAGGAWSGSPLGAAAGSMSLGAGMGRPVGGAMGLATGPMDGMAGPDGGLFDRGLHSLGLGGGNLLTGSSFAFNRETRQGGMLSFWSRGARSSFAGREGALRIDGDVRTTMFGTDYAKGPMVAGLSLAHTRGRGGYRGRSSVSSGEVASSVTGLYPWLGYTLSDRVSVWGVTGYGKGALTLTPGEEAALQSGLSMAMAAGGVRGELADSVVAGFGLAFKADALWVGTAIDGVEGPGGNLAAVRAAVTRFRTGLEASRGYSFERGLSLQPSLELGIRRDGGDAETGAGVDIGGGLVVSDRLTGLSADVRVRMLLAHQDEGFSERGMSIAFSFDPTPSTPLGFLAKVTPSWGGQATAGSGALWGRETMAGVAVGGPAAGGRIEAELGYGMPVGGRFVSTPRFGIGASERGRDYRLGYSLTVVQGAALRFELGVDAHRREIPAQGGAEHGVQGRLTARW